MKETISLPKLGDTADDVLVTEWVADIGQHVAAGDVLFTAETDKIDVEVPCPKAGRLLERLVAVEDEVSVGDPIAVLDV